MSNKLVARRVEINGIVQGVGFRPFVFQLAHRHGIKGDVANTSSGVIINAEGPPSSIEAFCSALATQHPPLAHITRIQVLPANPAGAEHFLIVKSQEEAQRNTLISPDVCVCADCLRELRDPADRRYRYPFINCTNCGPRYTIINDVPYDRPHTSMRVFPMCAQCQAEYDDPLDRRFHAQPNACPVCGPQVALLNGARRPLETDDPIAHAAELLKEGHILAIKGLGGFHLAVDAENGTAVERLRRRKQREEKPFALMSLDVAAIQRYARISPPETELLLDPRRPIVLLRQRSYHGIAAAVAPHNRYFGVMLPYTPLHYLLLDHGFSALVMTSGNLSEEPIAIDNQDAFTRLADIADFFLVHDRDIYLRSDDSIACFAAGAPRMLRRSRGYVPKPVFLRQKGPQVLACGAHLKNTVCLIKDEHAFLSQHLGDMENQLTDDFFRLTIAHLKRILDIEPEVMAHDLHPDYLSSRYALEQNWITGVAVQHHHAHIVACMAENQVAGPVIGLSFDGTGLGADGHSWGGEVLVADEKAFERAGHIAYVGMPGSNAAVKEPWRMAVSYLAAAFGEGLFKLDLPLIRTVGAKKVRIMVEMLNKKLNCPLTSSLGRLFDGVAALLGVRSQVNFEGQAAMELEMLASNQAHGRYDLSWSSIAGARCLEPVPLIQAIVADMQKGVAPAEISAKFHRTLIDGFSTFCETLRTETRINQVALSGGVFQNRILLEGFTRALTRRGFEVLSHRLVPANDGGLSLGQAVAAAAMLA